MIGSMTTTPRRVLAVAAALSLAALLGACASPTPGSTSGPAATTSPTAGGEAELAAAWLDDGRGVGVVSWGSSTCIPIAGEPTYADGVVTVELSDVEGQACTRDYVPRGTFITLPAGVDPSHDLEIAVTGTYAGNVVLPGDTTLTADPATEYLPSAGWFGKVDFLLLSWGSSTCIPQLEKAEATGEGEVTATFVTPPANQVCTADMAPRVTVGSVADLEGDAGTELLLVGGGFDNVRVPIAGVR
jgi:hypothetical protein